MVHLREERVGPEENIRRVAVNGVEERRSGTCVAVLFLLAKFDEGINVIRRTGGMVSRLVNVVKGKCMLSK